jgi:trehalose 6-phosphate phosphatase
VKHILSKAHRGVVEQFAWSHVLLGFDFDGTLAPIVREPSEAFMRASTRSLLHAVASTYPCTIISGRSRDDVRRRLDGIPLLEVIGNHGSEPESSLAVPRAMRRMKEEVAAWAASLRDELAAIRGVEVEDKTLSIAVHFRKSRARNDARKRIDAAVAKLGPSARVVTGKLTVNITPKGAPHKGEALQRLRSKHGADTAIYVGDDRTDEDVFALDEPGRLLSIRVGSSSASQASYYLRNQQEIDDLLRLLASRRPVPHAMPMRSQP